ncbi:MAG: hypothetical protein WBE13_06435 [Candidatus Acidiferrum sp.]
MKRTLVLLALIAFGFPVFGQGQWARTEKKDELRGTAYTQFVLTGKFLTPPKQVSADPTFVVDCIPGEHRQGATWEKRGKFVDAYIAVGAVVDFHENGTAVRYRLDDGKVHSDSWGHSTDGTGIFAAETQLSTLLYGHFMPHKEGSGEPIRKAVIAVDEYQGAEVVMEFNLPDPTLVADACGLILHKR